MCFTESRLRLLFACEKKKKSKRQDTSGLRKNARNNVRQGHTHHIRPTKKKKKQEQKKKKIQHEKKKTERRFRKHLNKTKKKKRSSKREYKTLLRAREKEAADT